MILRAACLASLLALSAVDIAHGQTVEPAICATDIEPAATVEVSSFQTRRRPIETLVVRPTGPANGAATPLSDHALLSIRIPRPA